MLTGQGLLGKLVMFVAEKLVGHKLALSLDERKRACRAFAELYYCLDRLEEINSRWIELLSLGMADGGLLIGDLQCLVPSTSTVSGRLLEIRGELHFAIELLDPALARTVRQLYAAKGGLLSLLALGLDVESCHHSAKSVTYLSPNPKILRLDMVEFDNWVKQHASSAGYQSNQLEWPQNLLWFGEIEQGFADATLELANPESLSRLRNVLVEHGQVLAAAREKLREFVVARFSVEDVLYVSRDLPRAEF